MVGVCAHPHRRRPQRLVLSPSATLPSSASGIGLLIRRQPARADRPLIAWTRRRRRRRCRHRLLRKRPVRNGPRRRGRSAGSSAPGAPPTSAPARPSKRSSRWPCRRCRSARLGITDNPEMHTRTIIDQKSRAVIFLGPALLFIFVTLLVPTIRTDLPLAARQPLRGVRRRSRTTSPRSRPRQLGRNWVHQLLHQPAVLDRRRPPRHRRRARRVPEARTGKAVELGGPSLGPLVVAGVLLAFAFALFTALRGTIVNNLWWVVAVTLFSTARPGGRGPRRQGQGRAHRQVDHLHADGDLDGRRLDHLALHVRQPRHQRRADRRAQRLWVGLGRLSTGSGLPTSSSRSCWRSMLIGLASWSRPALVKAELRAAAVVPGVSRSCCSVGSSSASPASSAAASAASRVSARRRPDRPHDRLHHRARRTTTSG
jgi:hypothetical protein